MKIVWIVFGLVMMVLVGAGIWENTNIHDENVDSRPGASKTSKLIPPASVSVTTTIKKSKNKKNNFIKHYNGPLPVKALRDSLVQFALKQKGLPYETAGIARTGFDCSGFVHFTFAQFGIDVPHSSELLAKEGIPVSVERAQKADIVIFTGTSLTDRTPGHVGIVISNPEEPIQFVHSSSNGGVKVSAIDSTGYKQRFLQVRRLF